MASDDDVIRKRLMVDGDGGGDERRLTALLKLYMKWCGTADADHLTHQKMLSFLTQSECALTKASYVYEMNRQQMEKYKKIESEIGECVEVANREIESCKAELEKAKLVRKNRQQYDVMAEVVLQHPDRVETEKKIVDCQEELKEMRQIEQQQIEKLNTRKKQCHALLTSIHQLQSILKTECEIEENASFNEDVQKMDIGDALN